MSKSERASPGGSHRLVHLADAALGVGVGAFLFAPDRGGQNQIGQFRGGRRMVAILHDQEVEIRQAHAAAGPDSDRKPADSWR